MKRKKVTSPIRLPQVNVEEVRQQTGLSVEDFAQRFGLTPASVKNWEAGHTEPYGVARILLAIIAHDVLRPPGSPLPLVAALKVT